MKWKLYKESQRESGVGITCKIKIHGNSPDEVIEKLHEELLNIDAHVTDGNGEPDPKLIEKYRYWDNENEGDVSFSIYKSPNTIVVLENERI